MILLAAIILFASYVCQGVIITENDDLTFRYVTAYHKEGRIIKKDDLEKTSVNVLKPIIFIINGINKSEKTDGEWYRDIMEEYLKKQTQNVFIVDWTLNVDTMNNRTESIGLAIADFIRAIFDKTGESYLNIHLVGVFLGSKVSNVAAKRVSELTGRKVNRITALEPTYYSINDENIGLDKENANFLDVIHSNLSKFREEIKQYGHVNFYVDDEECDESDDTYLCGIFITSKLFAKSINSVKFRAVKCPSVQDFQGGKCEKNESIIFGENTDINTRGNYFLKVHPNSFLYATKIV